MNLGLRTILLAAAVVLFLIALFTDENYFDLVALGLMAFAGAFLVEGLGLAERTFGRTDSDRT